MLLRRRTTSTWVQLGPPVGSGLLSRVPALSAVSPAPLFAGAGVGAYQPAAFAPVEEPILRTPTRGLLRPPTLDLPFDSGGLWTPSPDISVQRPDPAFERVRHHGLIVALLAWRRSRSALGCLRQLGWTVEDNPGMISDMIGPSDPFPLALAWGTRTHPIDRPIWVFSVRSPEEIRQVCWRIWRLRADAVSLAGLVETDEITWGHVTKALSLAPAGASVLVLDLGDLRRGIAKEVVRTQQWF